MSSTPLRTPTLLSVVAPVYDEEELVEDFVARACAAAADYEFELVMGLDRRARDAWLQRPERRRFLRGMPVGVGSTQPAVSYEREARYAGETKYPLRKMLRFSLDAIASFSPLPLQLATYAGLLSAGVAFIAIPVVIALRVADSYLPGFSSITIAILLLGGIQLIAIGVIGEDVGSLYDEVKHRPLYIVREELNRPNTSARAATGPVARAGLPARTPDRIL